MSSDAILALCLIVGLFSFGAGYFLHAHLTEKLVDALRNGYRK